MKTVYSLLAILSCCAAAGLGTPVGDAVASTSEVRFGANTQERHGDSSAMLSTIRKLTATLNKCGVDTKHISQMQKVMLNGEGKCMDGSPAGYYMRKSQGSKKWLVFLEGGSYCFDRATCRSRASNSPNLTSSNGWPSTREGLGILSWDPEENPFLFFANIVYVPYCSSDAWTGNGSKGGHTFMGSVIIEEVMADLLKHGLKDANKLFLAGSSAGATGVLLNVDRVASSLLERAPGVNVLGIVDSGWFVDVAQYSKTKCTTMLSCAPIESIKKGSRYWRAHIPASCEREYRRDPWSCFFGYRLYPFIKTPIFIIQYLFDTAQMLANMGYGTIHKLNQQENYSREQKDREQFVQQLGRKTNETLQAVSAVFAPACYSHEILTQSYWFKVAIKGRSLVDALKCWEESQEATNRVRPASGGSGSNRDRRLEGSNSGRDRKMQVGSRTASVRHPDGRQNRRLRKSEQRQQDRGDVWDAESKRATNGDDSLRLRKRDDMSELDALALTNQLIEYKQQKLAQCQYKILDECDHPFCNFKCPSYLALFSGSTSSEHSGGGGWASSASSRTQNSPSGSSTSLQDLFLNNR